jgi:hypothetical protein
MYAKSPYMQVFCYDHSQEVYMPKETKPCQFCHKSFAIRKQWASKEQWESIKFCSKLCAKREKEARSSK